MQVQCEFVKGFSATVVGVEMTGHQFVIVVFLLVPLNNIKVFSVVRWLPFALFFIHKIFYTVVRSTNVLRHSHKVRNISLRFQTYYCVSREIFAHNIKFHENPSRENRADICGQMERRTRLNCQAFPEPYENMPWKLIAVSR